ncbi:MAG: NAD(P)H-binding protein [Pseudomonadota bacterium]
MRVVLAGATGTIGRAAAAALAVRGHEVIALVRPGSVPPGEVSRAISLKFPALPEDVSDALKDTQLDALVSCLASRTGAPADAWAIDHHAHLALLSAAREHGARHFVALSAICVQEPELAFQHAKLAFEAALRDAPITHSIVRPTAYFKSLSGQVRRVMAGKPFLVFGDGTLTACKPISDADLGAYMADCLTDETRWNATLPIGGPGPAITPLDQARYLFDALGKPLAVKKVPVALMSGIVGVLSAAGLVSSRAAAKAELARIGRFYGTHSMLVLDPVTGRPSAELTPETGSERLFDYYDRLLSGEERVDLGEHAVF